MAMDPDYDSDSAVEQIVAEAMDLHVLQQISSINLSASGGVSSSSNDSLLPTDLEIRFRKLKSFPAANPRRSSSPPQLVSSRINQQVVANTTFSNPPSEIITTIAIPISSSSPILDENDLKPNPRNRHLSSPSLSSSSSSSSEAAQDLCFWCSPKTKKKNKKQKKKKKSSKDKSRTRRRINSGDNDNDDDLDLDSFLSDFSKFSGKRNNRSLKRALKEQEKISREAEKMVNFAKQLSARMDDFVIHHHHHHNNDELK